MADATIKDVLKAIATLTERVGEMATKKDLDAKVDGFRAEMNGRFDGVDKSIAELGEDLDKHMVVHKKLEKQVETLKAKPARPAARMPRRR